MPAATQAAVAGREGRLRPILMTSCAMIAGMVPMALGWSEGGEQTAPLGRAVIGGLAAATLATLVVLPTVFAIVQGGAGRASASLDPDDPESSRYDPSSGQRHRATASGNGEPVVHELRTATVHGSATLRVRTAVAELVHSRSQIMRQSISGMHRLAALVAIATHRRLQPSHRGQGRPRAGPAVTRVEVVTPERRTIRRSTEQPGRSRPTR